MSDTLLELKNLIERYRVEHMAWLATRISIAQPEGDVDEAWNLDETSLAILRLPCRSIMAAELKVSAVLEIEGLYTIVKEDFDDDGDILRMFVASLCPDRLAHGAQDRLPRTVVARRN